MVIMLMEFMLKQKTARQNSAMIQLSVYPVKTVRAFLLAVPDREVFSEIILILRLLVNTAKVYMLEEREAVLSLAVMPAWS